MKFSFTMRGFILCVAVIFTAFPSYAKKDSLGLRGESKFKPQNRKILKTSWTRSLKSGKPAKRYYPETSEPVVFDGIIYVGTQGKYFYAIDQDTGKVVWHFKNDEPIAAAAAVQGNRVFFADLGGRMNCLSTESGALQWSQEFDGEMLGQPLIAEGKVYVLKGERDVVALSDADGHVVWNRSIKTFIKDMTMRGHAGLVSDGGRLFVGLADGQIYALSEVDGKILWSQNLTVPLKSFKDIDAAVVVDGDSLYVGGYFDRFYRLNKATGAKIWSSDVGTGVSPLVLKDRVIVSDSRGRVVGLDKQSGRQLWFNEVNRSILSQPALFQDKIFVATYDQDAFLLDPDHGGQIQKIGVSTGAITAPVVEGDQLLVLTNGAKLVSFEAK